MERTDGPFADLTSDMEIIQITTILSVNYRLVCVQWKQCVKIRVHFSYDKNDTLCEQRYGKASGLEVTATVLTMTRILTLKLGGLVDFNTTNLRESENVRQTEHRKHCRLITLQSLRCSVLV